jgi:hypothetical protein
LRQEDFKFKANLGYIRKPCPGKREKRKRNARRGRIGKLVGLRVHCNPSYSGGSDQEDLSSKLAWAIALETISGKYPKQKRTGGVAQVVGYLQP